MYDALQNATIAAFATPPGRGGIAVLRLSGPAALSVLGRIFTPARTGTEGGPRNAEEAGFTFQPRRLHYGRALDSRGAVLDEVLAVSMPGPASVTGEDVGELHCHAGPGICAALLEAAVAAGAVPAGPGDFTRRAFLNGRLDLTQAEAVAELCNARTGEGARLAAAKLGGALGRETSKLRGALDDLRLQCVLDADFPEEETEFLTEEAFRHRIEDCASALRRLLSAYERARFWREGASAVLAGRVNAGKSSLLNALLGRERAIVSDEAGTTRDYLEESLNLEGLELRLTDTAGLRADGGPVEAEGVRRARDLAAQADLVLFVKDIRAEIYPEEAEFLRLHRDACRSGGLIPVLNKIDVLPGPEAVRGACAAFAAALGALVREPAESGDEEMLSGGPGAKDDAAGQAAAAVSAPCGDGTFSSPLPIPPLPVSALRGDGLDSLSAAVRAALTARGGTDPGDIVPNLRQSELMRAALAELDDLEVERARACPRDILALHLERAAQLLDEVSGAAGSRELLERIFSTFCIGK
ncbi:MAG: tRNA modification GTPase [Desulfovibrio sp.]|nr:tRNA modification GTPase [Desulfovibrio sp.]